MVYKSLIAVLSDNSTFDFSLNSFIIAVAGDFKDEGIIRKVDEMNPDYILRDANAVLNWFDITAPEGRYSLNDTIGDIMKPLAGKIWFLKFFMLLAKKQSGPKEKSKDTRGGKKKAQLRHR